MIGIGARETEDSGIVVTEITPGSGAEKAGLKEGDLLLKIGATEVSDFASLAKAMKNLWAGDKVKVKISRDGKEMDVELTLGERP